MNNMSGKNQTRITEFLLLGLEIPHGLRFIFFLLLLVLYNMTLIGNISIIALFLRTQQLHTPMYFFLCHLSLSDILLSTNIVPNLLCTLLKEGRTMSVNGCITQFFASAIFASAECFLLTVMSYDRYLAICNPLHYNSIMSTNVCFHLAFWSWFLAFLLSMIFIIPVFCLEFCGCNVIDHIYCDLAPLLETSCSETSFIELEAVLLSIPVVLTPFLFLVLTYASIFHTIIKISSNTGKQKAFSTCTSHLTVVSIYYGPLIAKYTVPSRGNLLNLGKFITLLYILITPLFNPIIYSLRNQEIRRALQNLITKNMTR